MRQINAPPYISVARDGVPDSFDALRARFRAAHPSIDISLGLVGENNILRTTNVQIIVIRKVGARGVTAEFIGTWESEPKCIDDSDYHGEQSLRSGDVIVIDSESSVILNGCADYVAFTSREATIMPLHRGLRRSKFFKDESGNAKTGCATGADAYRRLQIPQSATDTPRILRCHLVYMIGARFHNHDAQGELYIVHDRQGHGLKDTRPQSVWTFESPDHIGQQPDRTLLETGDIVFLPAPVIHRGGGLEADDRGGQFDLGGTIDGGTLASVIAIPEFQTEYFYDGRISRDHPTIEHSLAHAADQSP